MIRFFSKRRPWLWRPKRFFHKLLFRIMGPFCTALWGCTLSAPLFLILLFVGLLKGALIASVATPLLFVGNMTVAIGLWPAFIGNTYYSLYITNVLGPYLKALSLVLLPVPLVLWILLVGAGSLLVGIGYGFFSPLVATFEASRKTAPWTTVLTEGTFDILTGTCTIIRDFADFCYHSYFSYLEDISNMKLEGRDPYDIKLLEIPKCIIVGLLGIIIDVPLITIMALIKGPFMLLKGWQRLLHDLYVREGPFLEAVCVPFAGFAILFWPLVVVVCIVLMSICSCILGLYAAAVVYQETSLQYGLAYIIAVVAEVDEYTNDILYLKEGSCLPRPIYRKTGKSNRSDNLSIKPSPGKHDPGSKNLLPSRSIKQEIQKVKIVQIWDSMFKAYEERGKMLIQEGVITFDDLEEWNHSRKSPQSRIIAVGFPAYCLLQALFKAVKSGSGGLVLSDGTEVTIYNRPQDNIMDWFFDPVLILKEQIKMAHLQPSEELYLEKLVLSAGDVDRLKAWQNGGIEPNETIRRAEVQALARRIQGIASSISRYPTHNRRYSNIINSLMQFCIEKNEASGSKSIDHDINDLEDSQSKNGSSSWNLRMV